LKPSKKAIYFPQNHIQDLETAIQFPAALDAVKEVLFQLNASRFQGPSETSQTSEIRGPRTAKSACAVVRLWNGSMKTLFSSTLIPAFPPMSKCSIYKAEGVASAWSLRFEPFRDQCRSRIWRRAYLPPVSGWQRPGSSACCGAHRKTLSVKAGSAPGRRLL